MVGVVEHVVVDIGLAAGGLRVAAAVYLRGHLVTALERVGSADGGRPRGFDHHRGVGPLLAELLGHLVLRAPAVCDTDRPRADLAQAGSFDGFLDESLFLDAALGE